MSKCWEYCAEYVEQDEDTVVISRHITQRQPSASSLSDQCVKQIGTMSLEIGNLRNELMAMRQRTLSGCEQEWIMKMNQQTISATHTAMMEIKNSIEVQATSLIEQIRQQVQQLTQQVSYITNHLSSQPEPQGNPVQSSIQMLAKQGLKVNIIGGLQRTNDILGWKGQENKQDCIINVNPTPIYNNVVVQKDDTNALNQPIHNFNQVNVCLDPLNQILSVLTQKKMQGPLSIVRAFNFQSMGDKQIQPKSTRNSFCQTNWVMPKQKKIRPINVINMKNYVQAAAPSIRIATPAPRVFIQSKPKLTIPINNKNFIGINHEKPQRKKYVEKQSVVADKPKQEQDQKKMRLHEQVQQIGIMVGRQELRKTIEEVIRIEQPKAIYSLETIPITWIREGMRKLEAFGDYWEREFTKAIKDNFDQFVGSMDKQTALRIMKQVADGPSISSLRENQNVLKQGMNANNHDYRYGEYEGYGEQDEFDEDFMEEY